MSKYKKVFEEMLRQNKLVFDEFKKIHDNYRANPKTYKDQFNEEGEKIQIIIIPAKT